MKRRFVLDPIREEDFIKLQELTTDNSKYLIDYIRGFCLFRMSMFGYSKENPNTDQLDQIIQELGQKKEGSGVIQLPQPFEIARNILLRVKDKKDFDRILQEVIVA